MDKQQFNVTVEDGIKELVIRYGDAEKIIGQHTCSIVGVIDAPLEYLKVRYGFIPAHASNLQIDRENLCMCLTVGEQSDIKSEIIGCLTLTEEFKSFSINSAVDWTPNKLGDFIKMNRSCFESKEVANSIVSKLKDVKFKVDKVVENNNGTRGNIRHLKEQTVKECNIPETIELVLPIFKGTSKVHFTVEIWISPDDLSISLISPQAADIIREVRDNEIDKVKAAIAELCPDLAIIEK